MKAILITIVVIIILALVGNPLLIELMRAAGMLTGNTLG